MLAGGGENGLRRLFVLANLEFTLSHEFSHVLIDELTLPILGMEEDAADRIAIISMLMARQQKSERDIIPWVFAVAGDWHAEWELRDSLGRAATYWDSHRLEIQRFHNVVCLIYGSNPDALEGLMDSKFLPFERAINCEHEYRQAYQAVQWVLNNYGHGKGAIRGYGESARNQGQGGKANDGTIKHSMIKKNLIKVVYAEPLNPENQRMLDWLTESEIAETLAQRLSARFSLPRDIRIEFENCGASPDAYWHQPTGIITVCYEMLLHFLKMAEYRLQHPEWACGIPVLRRYIDDRAEFGGSPCNPEHKTATGARKATGKAAGKTTILNNLKSDTQGASSQDDSSQVDSRRAKQAQKANN